nr:MAG TPA: hypothetical protein [Caudoviricetes sp.]
MPFCLFLPNKNAILKRSQFDEKSGKKGHNLTR